VFAVSIRLSPGQKDGGGSGIIFTVGFAFTTVSGFEVPTHPFASVTVTWKIPATTDTEALVLTVPDQTYDEYDGVTVKVVGVEPQVKLGPVIVGVGNGLGAGTVNTVSVVHPLGNVTTSVSMPPVFIMCPTPPAPDGNQVYVGAKAGLDVDEANKVSDEPWQYGCIFDTLTV
jgi:hypothetical protein